MYLIQIDKNTGLIKEDTNNDSWAGITCFRTLVERDGLKALTAIALSYDYLSIYSHYKESDRPVRVAEELYGNREAIDFIGDELIVECAQKYKELQFNPDLEQERIFTDRKINLLERINKANNEEDDGAIDKYTKQLQDHEATIAKFNSRFDKEKAISNSVTSSGYSLSRIENDIKSRKNSKFLDKTFAKNPSKLKLEDE